MAVRRYKFPSAPKPSKTLRRSIKQQSKRASDPSSHVACSQTIPVAGSILTSGRFLELVRVGEKDLLLHGLGKKYRIAPIIADDGLHYAPTPAAGLIEHLPSKPARYRSTEALFAEVADFIAKKIGTDEDEAMLLAFISVSSYFTDCLNTSPCLLVFGAPFQATALLRALACVCRHALLSVGSSVAGVPAELRPTRLICQPDVRVDRQLAAFQLSGFGIFDPRPRQISGTTVIYAGNAELKNSFADLCLEMWVPPASHLFGMREEEQAAETINNLQNHLLAYRLENYFKVRMSEFDVPEFAGATREYARTIGRCIVDSRELQSRLVTLFRERDNAERTESASTLDVAVLEALAVCCHERKSSVHVGEIASLANGILRRGGEAVELSAKQVGGRVKGLGFRTTRLDAAGRGIYLLNGECARVHKLGRGLGAPIFREGLQGCPYCEAK